VISEQSKSKVSNNGTVAILTEDFTPLLFVTEFQSLQTSPKFTISPVSFRDLNAVLFRRRANLSTGAGEGARRGEAGARAHRVQRGRQPQRPHLQVDVQQLGGQRGRHVGAGHAQRHPELALVHADD